MKYKKSKLYVLIRCLHVTEFLSRNTPGFVAACGTSEHLKQLAREVPDVLDAARAPSTAKLYRNAYKRWKDWTLEHNKVFSLPASPHLVILYLLHLNRKAASFSSINLAACAIAWGHNLAGLVSPTKDILVSECLAGLKAKLAKPRLPKEPLQLSHIRRIFSELQENSLTDLRDTCIIFLAFYGFLRFDELSHLRVKHICIRTDHLELHIERAKNDQLREGNYVCIAKLDCEACPVALLQKYLFVGKLINNADMFCFRRIIMQKGVKLLQHKNLPMSYGSVRSLVKAKAKQIGLDPAQFGTHSMRSGGCTTAANAGVKDRIFQRHGRWASVSAKNSYVKDSLDQKLAVTLAMQ